MITTDLNLASYLVTKGFKMVVTKVNGRGEFEFADATKEDKDAYFAGAGQFMVFANNIRNLKATVNNLEDVRKPQ